MYCFFTNLLILVMILCYCNDRFQRRTLASIFFTFLVPFLYYSHWLNSMSTCVTLLLQQTNLLLMILAHPLWMCWII